MLTDGQNADIEETEFVSDLENFEILSHFRQVKNSSAIRAYIGLLASF